MSDRYGRDDFASDESDGDDDEDPDPFLAAEADEDFEEAEGDEDSLGAACCVQTGDAVKCCLCGSPKATLEIREFRVEVKCATCDSRSVFFRPTVSEDDERRLSLARTNEWDYPTTWRRIVRGKSPIPPMIVVNTHMSFMSAIYDEDKRLLHLAEAVQVLLRSGAEVPLNVNHRAFHTRLDADAAAARCDTSGAGVSPDWGEDERNFKNTVPTPHLGEGGDRCALEVSATASTTPATAALTVQSPVDGDAASGGTNVQAVAALAQHKQAKKRQRRRKRHAQMKGD